MAELAKRNIPFRKWRRNNLKLKNLSFRTASKACLRIIRLSIDCSKV